MRLASPEIAAPFVHELLSRDGAVWVHESSDSMAPLVRGGDRLRLAPIVFADIRPGHIVAYRRGAQLIVHRVLSRDATSLVAKGDGLGHRDAVVPSSDVVGCVTAIASPHGRRIELDALPWSALGRWLAWFSRASEWTDGSGLGWKLTRLPAHLAAWWAR